MYKFTALLLNHEYPFTEERGDIETVYLLAGEFRQQWRSQSLADQRS